MLFVTLLYSTWVPNTVAGWGRGATAETSTPTQDHCSQSTSLCELIALIALGPATWQRSKTIQKVGQICLVHKLACRSISACWQYVDIWHHSGAGSVWFRFLCTPHHSPFLTSGFWIHWTPLAQGIWTLAHRSATGRIQVARCLEPKRRF